MIPTVLAEAYAVYREVSYGKQTPKITRQSYNYKAKTLASESPIVQSSRDYDNVFPLIAVLLMSETAKSLRVSIGEEAALIQIGLQVLESENFRSSSDDPLSKISNFMRLFAHQYAASGEFAPHEIVEAVDKLKENSGLLDIFGNAPFNRAIPDLVNSTILSDEVMNRLFVPGDIPEARQFILQYTQRLVGDTLPMNNKTKDYITSLISGNILFTEIWLVMIHSAIITALSSDSRGETAHLGSLTFLSDAMLLTSPKLTAYPQKRNRFQTRPLIKLDIYNAETKIAEQHGIQDLNPKYRKDGD